MEKVMHLFCLCFYNLTMPYVETLFPFWDTKCHYKTPKLASIVALCGSLNGFFGSNVSVI